MATTIKLWLYFYILCINILLISAKKQTTEQKKLEPYYYHPKDIQNEKDIINIINYDGERIHKIFKRETEINTTTVATNNPLDTNRSTSMKKYQNVKKVILAMGNKNPNGTEKFKMTPKHNLGENGAGIKLNLTSTVPPLTSTTIASFINNATTVNTVNITANVSSGATSVNISNLPNATSVVVNTKNNQTGEDDDVISISKFAEDEQHLNETLIEKSLSTKTDTHLYYNSTFMVDPVIGQAFWVNMTNRTDVRVNELLSKSHRRAATVHLSFDFPYYGHVIRNITIATGGFLYTGEFVHNWLAATQYIAPLMANFDTSLSNDSFVKYIDNGTALTVLWEKVALQDKPNKGNFSFQATLHKNGDIVFVYHKVPFVIENIHDEEHPVKVGLSDAYIIDHTIFYVRRKTIYEYHRVNFKREDIKNWTVIYLHALPTCLDLKDCNSCLTNFTEFKCAWCSATNRCSNGMDRYRQEWLHKGCDATPVLNSGECRAVPLVEPKDAASRMASAANTVNAASVDTGTRDEQRQGGGGGGNVAGTVVGVMSVGLVLAVGAWVAYAYTNPRSFSGQLLIRYRPYHWNWRRGEARYTAATVHM